MFQRLHALGDHLDAERLADLDDRGDQPALALAGGDREDELPVDLQAFRLEREQAQDRGVAGAEIVDFDIDAEGLDLGDAGFQAGALLVEGDRFKQFEA